MANPILSLSGPAAHPAPASPKSDLERLLAPQGIEPMTAAQFGQLLEAHHGKVVIVNLWATFCIPCLQELPDLDLLQERYRSRDVLVLAISMDNPAAAATKVAPFFSKQAPHLISYINAEADEFDFVTTFDPEWVGALPTTYFFNRQGELKERHVGRMMYRDFERKTLEILDPQ